MAGVKEGKAGGGAVAIVGIGCRFPGGLDSPGRLWEGLLDRIDAIGNIPRDRFDAPGLHRLGSGGIASVLGGYLEGIDRFDADFFGISPREAERLDPQQRLLLELSYEALEDAGILPESIAGSPAGIFVGLFLSDFEARLFADPAAVDLYSTTGTGRYAASGRLSFAFGCEGPSLTVDTACSSSLVAVHLAVQSLRARECDLAIAAGANVILQPQYSIAYSRSGMIAPDGRCKFGDARGDGYVRSEGAGVVVLKRLEDATRDGDRVYAVIAGSSVTNDGRSGDHLSTPAQGGQERMLRVALADAGIEAGRVCFVEAHGTGTSTGDPVEIGALAAVLGEGRAPDGPLAVGSIKTNVGHTEGAAGIAGLIKASLVLYHRSIPPSLHFEVPNPRIPWDRIPIQVPVETVPLPRDPGTAAAGVSSFGITGTNAHVVLTEAPPWDRRSADFPEWGAVLLPLSADTEPGLFSLARRFADRIDAEGPDGLADLVYTAACRRPHHAHRLCIVGARAQELSERLRAVAEGRTGPGTTWGSVRRPGRPRLVFVYPGQGSQWTGMGRRLLAEEPAFRETIEACEAAMRPYVDWSLQEQLEIREDSPSYRLDDVDVVQPALTAMDLALTALWRAWGIEPDGVIGHSMGEVAAACVAGALSLDEAMRVICERSRLLRRVRGRGAMAVVELSREEASVRVRDREASIAVAASNSPRSTVVSGETHAVDALLAELEEEGVFARRIKVDVASHSPQVDELRAPLLEALASLQPGPARIPIYSSVRAGEIPGEHLDAAYWADNLRQPVLLAETVERAVGGSAPGQDADEEGGETIFLEVSPHPVLQPAIEQTLHELGRGGRALGTLRRDEGDRGQALLALGQLHVAGYPVPWERQWPEGGRVVSLPTYPWQRERYWFESSSSPRPRGAAAAAHPVLGDRIASAAGTWLWERELSLETHPSFGDHRVRGAAVVPATGFLEMALAGVVDAYGEGAHELRAVSFDDAALLQGTGRILQLAIREEAPGWATFQLSGREVRGEEAGEDRPDWEKHASGRVVVRPAMERTSEAAPPRSPEGLELAGPWVEGDRHYARMAARGLEYGPTFRRLGEHRGMEGEAVGRLRPVHAGGKGAQSDRRAFRRMDAALLDAGFQLLLGLDGQAGADATSTLIPVSLELFRIHQPEVDAHRVKVVRRPPSDGGEPGSLVGDVRFLGEDGAELALARGVRFRRMPAPPAPLDEWLHELHWEPRPGTGAGSAADHAARDARVHSDAVEGARQGVEGWLVLSDRSGFGEAVSSLLEEGGARVARVHSGEGYREVGALRYEVAAGRPDEILEVAKTLAGPDALERDVSLRGVLHLWALDRVGAEDEAALALGTAGDPIGVGALALVQALAGGWEGEPPRVWAVTRGAYRVGQDDSEVSAAQGALWGFGAAAANEHPELGFTCVDMAIRPDGPDRDAAAALLAEIHGGHGERRVALRSGTRYSAVLRRAELPSSTAGRVAPAPGAAGSEVASIFTAHAPAPGSLDALRLVRSDRQPPGSGEIEIEVAATSLNFIDVMKALGIYPGIPPGTPVGLGSECAGRIVAVGEGVERWEPGDEVVALARSIQDTTMLRSHATVPAELVFPVPEGLAPEEGAALPIAFLTAYYALFDLGRLERGERVLIHAATGGVGLAAVQLARRAGAEIFATAGSPRKRRYLREMGLDRVWDSRSLDFADGILEVTKGQGVDVVLNSLAGAGLRVGLSILAQHGRFVELGKRDIHADTPLGLGDFRRGISFAALDLVQLMHRKTARMREIFTEVLTDMEAGELRPLPVEGFPVQDLREAFGHFARAEHIGKVVVRGAETVRLDPVRPPCHPASAAGVIRPGASYLITGGLGALGLLTAAWLAERGARHLVLVGRSAPSEASAEQIRVLEAEGVEVQIRHADVSKGEEVEELFSELDGSMPPLAGVVHAAGMLADQTILGMEADRFEAPIAAKVRGAWHLHRLTADRPLDFFILYSSIAGLLGSPGQANYATANAFLDGLARHREALGLPALSVQWGPWSTVGLAAEGSRGERMADRGVGSLEPARALEALDRILAGAPPALAVVPFAADRWMEAAGARDPFLETLARTLSKPSMQIPRSSTREEIAGTPAGRQRTGLLSRHLREQIASVLRLQPDRVQVDRPFKLMGLDSLMALELRNRLESSLGVRLSATIVWNYPTIELLSPFLMDRMGLEAESRDEAGAGTGGAPSGERLAGHEPAETDGGESREELEALLASELAEVDELLKGGSE